MLVHLQTEIFDQFNYNLKKISLRNAIQNNDIVIMLDTDVHLIDGLNFEKLKDTEQHKELVSTLERLAQRRNTDYKGIFDEYQYIWS